MPGNLQPAAPVDVMPAGLCSAFMEELRLESFVNATYPDGSSDRLALSIGARRFWRFTRKVTAAQYTALYAFFKAHMHAPFFFYVLRETSPPWTWDATGTSTQGRYTVVFDGSWADTLNLGRSDVSLGLREVV